MKLQSIKTVIRTKDIEASKRFYLEIMGLELVQDYQDDEYVRGCILKFAAPNGNGFLELSEIKKGHEHHQPGFTQDFENDKVDIQLRTDDIDYWAKRLNDQWTARGPVDRPWGSKYLYLRDPDGLKIIIYQERSVEC